MVMWGPELEARLQTGGREETFRKGGGHSSMQERDRKSEGRPGSSVRGRNSSPSLGEICTVLWVCVLHVFRIDEERQSFLSWDWPVASAQVTHMQRPSSSSLLVLELTVSPKARDLREALPLRSPLGWWYKEGSLASFTYRPLDSYWYCPRWVCNRET